MRWNEMSRSIAFAAVTGVIGLAYWYLAGASMHWPRFCLNHDLGLFWIFTASAYAWGIAPGHGSRRRSNGLVAALVVGLSGLAALIIDVTSPGVLVVCAFALAGVRSTLLYPPLGLRSVIREFAILLGSLGLAAWMMQGVFYGPMALASGTWGFFLVQSLFFVGVRTTGPVQGTDRDPFDHAMRQLHSMLDDELR